MVENAVLNLQIIDWKGAAVIITGYILYRAVVLWYDCVQSGRFDGTNCDN